MTSQRECPYPDCDGVLVQTIKERKITRDAEGNDPDALSGKGRTQVIYTAPSEVVWLCSTCTRESKSFQEG